MPESEDQNRGALKQLDRKLGAFEASRRAGTSRSRFDGGAGEGYRILGQMLGGIFGGLGLGWLLDHFAHTSPWGLLGGLAIGAGLSIYATVRAATTVGRNAIPPPDEAAAVNSEDDR